MICLERGDQSFTLVSKSANEAKECVDELNCICNDDEEAWASTASINKGVAFPPPQYVRLAHWDALLEILEVNYDPYYANIYNELKNAGDREPSTIIHPINAIS